MENPFEMIDGRLSAIEQTLQELRKQIASQVTAKDEVLQFDQVRALLGSSGEALYKMMSERKIPSQ